MKDRQGMLHYILDQKGFYEIKPLCIVFVVVDYLW